MKRRREKLMLTQKQLAKRLDVHVLTVSRWERGAVKIPRTVVLALRAIEAAKFLSEE